jgi:hypothetical protein
MFDFSKEEDVEYIDDLVVYFYNLYIFALDVNFNYKVNLF